MNIEQAKDAAARELGYDSFANANTWMHKHGQQFTEDPDNNIMFNIYNRAMELCIEGERQRILEALPTSEDAAFEMLIKYGGNTKMAPKLKAGFADGFNFVKDKIYDLINN